MSEFVDAMVEGLLAEADERGEVTFDDRADADPRWGGIVTKPGSAEE